MNILEGRFYSTAFRVIDDSAFEFDPAITELRKHLDIFSGDTGHGLQHCIVSKDCSPQTRLTVTRTAVMDLLADAGPSDVVLKDDCGWLGTLQKHLHPDDGIVIANEYANGQPYQTYIAKDCAGWTRCSVEPQAVERESDIEADPEQEEWDMLELDRVMASLP